MLQQTSTSKQKDLNLLQNKKCKFFSNDDSFIYNFIKKQPLPRHTRSNSFTTQDQTINFLQKPKGKNNNTLGNKFNPYSKKSNEKRSCESFQQLFQKREYSLKQQQCLKDNFENKLIQQLIHNNKKSLDLQRFSFPTQLPQRQNMKKRCTDRKISYQALNLNEDSNNETMLNLIGNINNPGVEENIKKEKKRQPLKNITLLKEFQKSQDIYAYESELFGAYQNTIGTETQDINNNKNPNDQVSLIVTSPRKISFTNPLFRRYINSQLPLSSYLREDKENKPYVKAQTEPSNKFMRQRLAQSVQVKVNRQPINLEQNNDDLVPWKYEDDFQQEIRRKKSKMR